MATTPAALAPGDTGTATATYTIQQSDIDTGSVTNTATTTGTLLDLSTITDISGTAQDNDDATITTLTQTSGITLIKSAVFNDTNGDGFAQAGESIRYSFSVTNTGNVSLSTIVIIDPLVAVTGGPITLKPGENDSSTFKAEYIITQLDADNGTVSNQASVSALTPKDIPVTTLSDSDDTNLVGPNDPTVTVFNQLSNLVLWKEGVYQDTNNDGKINVGDSVLYTFKVENTGTVTLRDIMITDATAPVTGGPLSSLAPGAFDATTFTALHIITAQDLIKGAVYNTAEVHGQTDKGILVIADSKDPTPVSADDPNYSPVCPDCTVVSFRLKSEIAIIKHAVFDDNNGDGMVQAGETITYSFIIINKGESILTDITVKDPLPGIVMTGGPISLAAGERDVTTFKGTYSIKQSDINAGTVANQATVLGTNYTNVTISDLSDDTDENGDNPTVLKLSGCVIKVFNAISVNGDNKNDTFQIAGIECYPDNEVTIFNRWGAKVYNVKGYDNRDKAFKGYSEGRSTIGGDNNLPEGTYFYILRYVKIDGSVDEKSGYLYIN